MTVSSQTSTATFVGNGVATAFPLPFRFFDNGDIRAYFIDSVTGAATQMVLGSDYTLIGAGEPEVDGNALSLLTTTAPLASMRCLYVERVMPQVQETDIVNQGQFFASTHEDVFDRLAMLIQQANGESKGAIRVAIGDPEPNRLPPAAARANLLLSFDTLGNPIVVAPASGSASDLAINLANYVDPAKGAALIGYAGGTLYGFLGVVALTPARFGIKSIEQGATDPVAEAAKWETMRVAAQSAKAHVIIPAGTYVLPQGVRLDAADTVWNFSPGAILKLWDTQANGDFLVFSAPSRQRVTGLTFDANRAVQDPGLFGGDHCGCIIIDSADFVIESTRVISSPVKGLALVSSAGGTSSNTTIRGVTGGDCNDQAVLVDGNNMTGFFKKIVLEDVQIGPTSHAGVAISDGAHDIQLNNISCDVNNAVWDAVAVRDCWDVQLNNVRGRRGINGVSISSLNTVCKRVQMNNVVGEASNASGVLLLAVEDVTGGNVTGFNNGFAGINVAQTGGGIRCKNISIANPSCFDDRGGGALQDYGLHVAGCDGAAFGKGGYHGNTVRGLRINRAVSTLIDVDVVQRKSATTGSIAATSSANVLVTFDVPFEDDEYDVSAEVFIGTASLALEIGHLVAKTVGGVTFLVRNTTAGALTGTLSVVASRRP